MLKYLFDVEFTDGSIYTQNAEDRSLTEPEKRSCFYDVQCMLDQGRKVKSFLLSDGNDTYLVDCTDGHFEINGKIFFMHERRDLTDFDLIFFRQHTHHFRMAATDVNEFDHEIVYRMGWQINVDGQNLQRVMEIL